MGKKNALCSIIRIERHHFYLYSKWWCHAPHSSVVHDAACVELLHPFWIGNIIKHQSTYLTSIELTGLSLFLFHFFIMESRTSWNHGRSSVGSFHVFHHQQHFLFLIWVQVGQVKPHHMFMSGCFRKDESLCPEEAQRVAVSKWQRRKLDKRCHVCFW